MPRVWTDNVITQTVAVAGQAVLSLTSELSSAESRFLQKTLLRTIVGLDVGRTVHDSGEGSERVALGIGIVSQEAFTAGVVPDPQTDTDQPVRGWVWRSRYRTFGFAADQPAVFTRRLDIDLRSMRKLDNGEMFFVADVIAHEGVSGAIDVVGIIRQLWLVG